MAAFHAVKIEGGQKYEKDSNGLWLCFMGRHA